MPPTEFDGGTVEEAITDPDIPQSGYESEDAAIVDINQLDLETEAQGDVDFDEMEERTKYAPSLTPGKFHNFIFKLNTGGPDANDAAWKPVEMKGKTEVVFGFSLQHIKEDGTPGRIVRFCDASTYRSGKMTSSRAQELLFALGKLPQFQVSQRKPGDILRLLQEADTEQKVISGQVKWEHRENIGTADAPVYQVTSTHPQKAYTKGDGTVVPAEHPWPRDEKGQFERLAGNEKLMRVAPTKETLEAMHKETGKVQTA